jgi:type I restriction enzyme S subunit
MELKIGYKKSEVGAIPVDWDTKQLKDITEKIMVGIASAATHAYRDRGIVMFRNQNIKSNLLDDTDILFISSDYEQLFKGKRLKTGDLLTARTGYPGTTCILPEKYQGSQSFTTLITRPNQKEIESNFLCFYINSEIGQAFFDTNQIGGGQKNVNAGTLKLMPIPIPPTKAEQSAIASALSDADTLITNLEKLITKKRNIKQGTMQKLLRPKEGWEVKKLGDVFTFYPTANYSKAEMALDGEIGCMHYGLIHAISTANYSLDNGLRYYVIGNKSEYELIKDGDVIMVDASEDLAGINKSIEIYGVGNKKLIAGLHTYLMRDENTVFVNTFRGLVLNSTGIKKQLLKLAVGMKVFGVSKVQLKEVLMPIPPLKEQLSITAILSDMDAEIAALETKLEKYKKVKLGMMQNLLTGKIRLV